MDLTLKHSPRLTETDEERRRRGLETLDVAYAALRERARRDKCEQRALKKAAGKQCRAMTKKRKRCGRKGFANGLCSIHGGLNAMQVLTRRKRKRAARYRAKLRIAREGDDRASAVLAAERLFLAEAKAVKKPLRAGRAKRAGYPTTTERT